MFLAGRQRETLLRMLEPLDEFVPDLPEGSMAGRGSLSGKLSVYTERPNKSFASADDCRAWLRRSLNQYANVFRPRLKALATSGETGL